MMCAAIKLCNFIFFLSFLLPDHMIRFSPFIRRELLREDLRCAIGPQRSSLLYQANCGDDCYPSVPPHHHYLTPHPIPNQCLSFKPTLKISDITQLSFLPLTPGQIKINFLLGILECVIL